MHFLWCARSCVDGNVGQMQACCFLSSFYSFLYLARASFQALCGVFILSSFAARTERALRVNVFLTFLLSDSLSEHADIFCLSTLVGTV